MDYIVTLNIEYTDVHKVNAYAKAPKDVLRTFVACGAKVLSYEPKRDLAVRVLWRLFFREAAKKRLSTICKRTMCDMFSCVKKGDRVFFQYSDAVPSIKPLMLEAKSHDALVHLLVHDVNFYRFEEPADKEMEIFSLADVLYVHTDAMADLLHTYNLKAEMRIMYLFDYYSNDPITPAKKVSEHKHSIIFAGNLTKSEFLQSLTDNIIPSNYNLNLYGLLGNITLKYDNICYKGKFNPDNPGIIEGGWGLLWDGPSINTCEGTYGRYLRINSSHKLSLYLTQGVPVIVWNESSLVNWVIKEKIGICINSLGEMTSKIDSISAKDYEEMIRNTQNIAKKLRNGGFLRSLIG